MTKQQPSRIVKADASSFDLRIGDSVMIQIDGMEGRQNALFLGMEKPKYLITTLENSHIDAETIERCFTNANPARLFYTSEGVLRGFSTKIIARSTSPYRHLYLTFPHSAEHFVMRQELRHQCHVPTTLSLNGEDYSGMTLNLSAGGCAVAVTASEDAAEEIENAGFIELSCQLITSAVETTAICKVMNLRRIKGKLTVGLCFEAISDLNKNRIKSFLRFLSRYTPGG